MDDSNLDEVIFQLSTVILLATTLITVTQLLSLPSSASYSDRTALSLCIFTSFIASLHYYLLSYAQGHVARTIVRHSDWFFTIPVIRMQVITLDDKHINPVYVNKMILGTIIMVSMSLMTEVVDNSWVRALTASTSVLTGEYSIRVVEMKRTPQYLKWCRTVYAWYTIVFVTGLINSDLHIVLDYVISLSDTYVKTTVSILTMSKIYFKYLPKRECEAP